MFKKAVMILNVSICLLFMNSWNLCAESTSKSPATTKLSFVLTNNPGENESGLNTGCSYKAIPAYTNPRDPKNTRLMDNDRPYNWYTTAGINCREDQNVIFDLKRRCRINMVGMLFDTPRKSEYIEVFVSDSDKGPWISVGEAFKEKEKNRWWKINLKNASGRYIRIFHKRGGWYLREVRLYGNVLLNNGSEKGKLVNGKLSLIKDGKALSTIVVSDNASNRTLDAASAFQSISRRMTGVWIPIVPESSFDGKSTPIYIGDSAAVRKLGIKVKQDIRDGDHYIVRRGKNYLALVGNDAPEFYRQSLRGSVYAVYHLFESIGCGWFGPDPLWQVVPETKTLAVPVLNLDERPAYLARISSHLRGFKTLCDAWRQGGSARGRGHAYNKLVPKKEYGKTHPEWFGKSQPDITNPEVIKMVISKLRKKIDKEPASMIVPFSFASNDCGGYVSNERTKKIGNISAQQLYFANEVAKGLNKTHRGRFYIDCLAYWHSHSAPSPISKAEPGVRISIVNEGDHTKAVNMPELPEIAKRGRNNTREMKATKGWLKTGGLVGVYEWHIPACNNKNWADIPWHPGEVSLQNLRFWYSKGIHRLFYETGRKEKKYGFPLRWAVYYQCHRGMWNPKLTVKKIMTDACGKLFGPASKAMMNYYAVFEKAMLETKEAGGNWHLPSPERVYTPAVESQADKWLKTAEKIASTCDNEKIKKRIAQEMTLWGKAKLVLAKLRIKNGAFDKAYKEYKAKKYKEAAILFAEAAKIAKTPSGKYNAMCYQGYSLNRLRKYNEAAKVFEDLMKVEKLSAAQKDGAFVNYLDNIYRGKKYKEVIVIADKIIVDEKATASMKNTCAGLATASSKMLKKYNEMGKWAKKIVELNPKGRKHSSGLLTLSQALRLQKKPEKAIQLLSDNIIAKMNIFNQTKALFERAYAFAELKKYDDVIAEYNKIYKLPKANQQHVDSAVLYALMNINASNNLEAADIWIERANTIKNKNRKVRALFCVAQNLQKRGKLADAKKKYEECVADSRFTRRANAQIAAINKTLAAK